MHGCASANARVVAALGLEGVAIVESEDAVFVMTRDEAQNVKKVVEWVEKRERRRQCCRTGRAALGRAPAFVRISSADE